MNILDLKGENALITGAGQGVGRQVALHFAAHNAGTVYVNDFSAERAASVVEEIRSAGGRAEAVACDVSDFGAMQATDVFPQQVPDLFVGRPVVLSKNALI